MNELEDGRVEDGEITVCQVCEIETHLYGEDGAICPSCAAEGWEWTKAYLIRRDDTICLNTEQIAVEADESFGKRHAIYAADGRVWMKRSNDPVLRRRYW